MHPDSSGPPFRRHDADHERKARHRLTVVVLGLLVVLAEGPIAIALLVLILLSCVVNYPGSPRSAADQATTYSEAPQEASLIEML
jgi:hypothetical protein